MSHSDRHVSHQVGLYFRLAASPTVAEAALEYLLDLGGEEQPGGDIRAALSVPRSSSARALADLVADRVVTARMVGRTTLYRVDTSDPLIRVMKTARAIRLVQVALRDVERLVDLAVLFGSASRGEDRADSDVDVFVVTREPDAVRSALADQPRIQGVVVTPAEHMRMLADDTAFARTTTDGIKLMGA
jgi:predicted nucleotidyltransferase